MKKVPEAANAASGAFSFCLVDSFSPAAQQLREPFQKIVEDAACVPLVDEMQHWDIVLARNPHRCLSTSCRAFISHLSKHLPPDDL
ncbi:hypothetical protein [uncultured Dysosmobacter sp.]|uniref:hypothetical protein n=1 Tax=uncultured Dysosmobacter sp. TaxID=2591384 RepID=UPI0026326981|nr:hypothetical protein [uncultured Dysosmobacter sp.]